MAKSGKMQQDPMPEEEFYNPYDDFLDSEVERQVDEEMRKIEQEELLDGRCDFCGSRIGVSSDFGVNMCENCMATHTGI